MSDAPWVGHAKAKVIFKPAPPAAVPAIPRPRAKRVSGADLYAAARRSGLEFGPAYQQVLAASRIGEDVILVDLVAAEAIPEYGLDPARLDACFHGLILLFAGNSSSRRPAAYLPVRFGEIRLEKPGAAIARARIDVRRHDARAIVADFALIDGDGGLIARLQGVRYQAVRPRGAGDLASHSLVPISILADEPTAIPHDPPLSLELLVKAAIPEAAAAGETLPPDLMLIEGWATAAAHRLARALAVDGAIAPDRLIAAGRFPAARRGWLVNLLVALEKSGLVRSDGELFVLADGFPLPAPRDILRSIAADYPHRSAELLLAARSSALMEALAGGESDDRPDNRLDDRVVRNRFGLGCRGGEASCRTLAPLGGIMAARPGATDPADRPWASVVGRGGTGKCARRTADDRRSQSPASRTRPPGFHAGARDLLCGRPRKSYRRLLRSHHRGGCPAPGRAGRRARSRGSSKRWHLTPCWPRSSRHPRYSAMLFLVSSGTGFLAPRPRKNRLSSLSDWAARFAATPLRGVAVKTIGTAAGPALLVAGQMPAFAGRRNFPAKVVIAGRSDPQQAETAGTLSSLLGAAGVACTIADERAFEQLPFADADTIVFLAPVMAGGATSAGHLAERCLTLKNCAAHLGKHKRRLWIESPGALRAAPGAAGPVETGFWAFTRSFANEFPTLDVRRVDLDPGLPARVKARRLADIILSGTAETEIILDAHSTRVVRLQARDSVAMAAQEPPAPASRLEKGEGIGLDRIRWMPIERRPPGPGQVEIAVAATGLNFRDVMWGLSVLPDEMLEDGLAGPALGLECAGHIVATGANVEGLNPGDAVVAITGGAFATHVTVDTRTVARVPAGLPLEAAVTIPVAFLTAYYGLVTCARLTPRRMGSYPWRGGRRRSRGFAGRSLVRRAGHRDREFG